MKQFFSTDITKKQSSDTGMAAVLILLLVGFFTENVLFYKIAIPVLVINMITPGFFYPFAIVWLGFSHLLGTVVSKILLSVVYFLLVTPVGLIRRWMGKDSLSLKEFKSSTKSVMKLRNHEYTREDLESPF
jgi:hypothetical protein